MNSILNIKVWAIRLLAVFCVSVIFSAQLAAEEIDEWKNFSPPPDKKYDWIQLSSGEWLKGELHSLYNFSFEFDSDELNLLKLDWSDIKKIRSAGLMSIKIESVDGLRNTHSITGLLRISGDKVDVIVDGKLRSYERRQVVNIVRAGENEAGFWSGDIGFGANLKSGNSENVDVILTAGTLRRTDDSRLAFDYVANFSRVKKVETTNNQRLNSYLDLFSGSQFFWRAYTAEYYRDLFKNIDMQLSVSSSFGYHFIRTSKTEWDVSGGAGALYKRFDSVEAGKNIDNTSPFIIFGTTYETELSSWLDFDFDFNVQIVDKDSGSYIHRMVTTLSTDITNNLDLDITFVWDRIRDPQPASDGSVPEQDDLQLIVGISYDF